MQTQEKFRCRAYSVPKEVREQGCEIIDSSSGMDVADFDLRIVLINLLMGKQCTLTRKQTK